MEKTMEQKLASKERFIAQKLKAEEMLCSSSLYDFINGLRYAYSLSIRYKSVNLKALVEEASYNVNVQRCLSCGIIKTWNNTYWFDKEKAESLQQFILEHN